MRCIFVDTGLLREGEAKQVMATFAEHLGVRVDMVDAGELFLRELAGVADPEQKRRSSAASSCTYSRRKRPSCVPEERLRNGWHKARSTRT